MALSIEERIQKLLELSKSPNENEAKVAMMKAQELLAKHELSLEEVQGKYTRDIEIVEEETSFSFNSRNMWVAKLAGVIAKNFGCKIFFRGHRSNRVIFLGKKDKAKVAKLTYEYALECVEKQGRREADRQRRIYGTAEGVKYDYALGFIRGLDENYLEQRSKHQEWGLVLVIDQETIEAYDNINFVRTIKTATRQAGSAEAYSNGKVDGKDFSMNRVEKTGDNPATLIK